MAKKVVASLQVGGKDFSKVIRMEKSPKTGAFVFKESIIPNALVNELLGKK